jgi:hypothetical protein
MSRRALPLALTAVALATSAGVGGCAYGTSAKLTTAQQDARVRFIKQHAGLTDHQLARLCPGLYPRTFLTDRKKYPLTKDDKARAQARVTAADRAHATAAGCAVWPGA